MRAQAAGATVALLAIAVLAACTDVTLGVVPPSPAAALDDHLEIDGTFCTEPAADTAFPVKLVFLIDLSNSMCYSDPASGACTAARCDQGPNNPGANHTPPRRMQAVQEVLDRFAGNPAVSFAVVTFSSNVQAYPYDRTKQVFTTDVSALGLDRLRNVDSVTDYQGALSKVKGLLAEDMANTAKLRKSELPRTKYAVIFLTDGAPFPRCSRAEPQKNNPPDAAACDTQPSTCTICQIGGKQNLFPALKAGEDYNAPYQLIQIVEETHRLAEAYGVGDLKFHSALLRVDNAVECCPVCFADDPDGTLAENLLRAVSRPDLGEGSFTRFTTTRDLSFVDYNFTSLRQSFAARTLVAVPGNMVASAAGPEVDTDGDGLSDDLEFRLGTDRRKADSDSDGYSDLFEHRRGGLFDPLVSNLARCQEHSLKCPDHHPCDTDGDGLFDCEEDELGTDPELVDSDADGLPDGVEWRFGLDPTAYDIHGDLDYDGIPNGEEVAGFSSPTERDGPKRGDWAVQVSLEELAPPTDGGGDGRACYRFAAKNLRLPSTLSRKPSGPDLGWSDTLVWLSEAPRGDLRDFGRIRVACVRARWVPPNVRLPLEPAVTLQEANFHDPAELVRDRDCVGAKP